MLGIKEFGLLWIISNIQKRIGICDNQIIPLVFHWYPQRNYWFSRVFLWCLWATSNRHLASILSRYLLYVHIHISTEFAHICQLLVSNFWRFLLLNWGTGRHHFLTWRWDFRNFARYHWKSSSWSCPYQRLLLRESSQHWGHLWDV